MQVVRDCVRVRPGQQVMVSGRRGPAAALAHGTSAGFDASDTLAEGKALAVAGGLAAHEHGQSAWGSVEVGRDPGGSAVPPVRVEGVHPVWQRGIECVRPTEERCDRTPPAIHTWRSARVVKNPETASDGDGLGSAAGAQLGVDVAEMDLHGQR